MKIIESFKGPEVAQAVGVPFSTLIYWVNTGLIKPSVQYQKGRGGTNLWSFADIVAVRVVAAMRGAGLSLQAIRKAVTSIRELQFSDRPLHETYLVSDGQDAYIVEGQQLTSVLRQPGQTVMRAVFGLDAVAAEVREITQRIVAERKVA